MTAPDPLGHLDFRTVCDVRGCDELAAWIGHAKPGVTVVGRRGIVTCDPHYPTHHRSDSGHHPHSDPHPRPDQQMGNPMTDPRWPTRGEVQAAAQTAYCTAKAEADVIAMVTDAVDALWRAATDDPATSPVGEVRRIADTAATAIKVSDQSRGWLCIADDASGNYSLAQADVRGWPVIGAVPGTAAAKADR